MTDVPLKAPEEQSELFGHEAAEQLFLQALRNNTIDGSWLICGPKGVGKATLAFRLKMLILSQKKKILNMTAMSECVPVLCIFSSTTKETVTPVCRLKSLQIRRLSFLLLSLKRLCLALTRCALTEV